MKSLFLKKSRCDFFMFFALRGNYTKLRFQGCPIYDQLHRPSTSRPIIRKREKLQWTDFHWTCAQIYIQKHATCWRVAKLQWYWLTIDNLICEISVEGWLHKRENRGLEGWWSSSSIKLDWITYSSWKKCAHVRSRAMWTNFLNWWAKHSGQFNQLTAVKYHISNLFI